MATVTTLCIAVAILLCKLYKPTKILPSRSFAYSLHGGKSYVCDTRTAGYIFLKMLSSYMGEDACLTYFDSLSPNVLAFTSSGSAPLSALVSKECGHEGSPGRAHCPRQ